MPGSPWRTVSPETQVAYTEGLFERAETEWLWAGPLALDVAYGERERQVRVHFSIAIAF